MSMFDGGIGPIDFGEVQRGIEEAMANMTPEQTAAFRQQFGDVNEPVFGQTRPPADQVILPEPTIPQETEEDRRLRLEQEQRQLELDFLRQQQEVTAARQRTDAFSRLRSLLSRVGLSELEGPVQEVITGGLVDLNDSNAILFALREQPAYQRRFAGNAARVRKGLPELDPGTYVGLEEQYRQLMQSNGLPAGFYDQADDFQKLIEGDVSPQELQSRIQQGYRRVRDADPEVRRQMRELYGVDDNALTAYFLDPERAQPLLERQARAAEIAARGREQAFMQLTATQAEELAARGITAEEAQARFAEQGALAGLYQTMAGEEALTAEQQLGATFGYDVQARQALERRRAQRVGEFQAGGGFARTTGATSGTVETGVGLAQ